MDTHSGFFIVLFSYSWQLDCKYRTDLSQSTSTNELPVLFRPDVDLEWKWLFDVSEENDIKDTYLGDIAAGSIEGKTAPNIEITFETTVTQVD